MRATGVIKVTAIEHDEMDASLTVEGGKSYRMLGKLETFRNDAEVHQFHVMLIDNYEPWLRLRINQRVRVTVETIEDEEE